MRTSTSRAVCTAAAAFAAVLGAAASSRADVTMVQRVDRTAPGTTNTTTTTTYISGDKVRVDNGQATMVIKGSNHTLTAWSPTTHLYQTANYRPTTIAQTGVTVTVTDTGKRSTMLGHPVRLYQVRVAMPGGGATAMTGSIWATEDIRRPNLSALGNPALEGFGTAAKIPGIPIKSVMHSPDGQQTMTTTVTKLTIGPVPASRFVTPSGYKRASQPAGAGAQPTPGPAH